MTFSVFYNIINISETITIFIISKPYEKGMVQMKKGKSIFFGIAFLLFSALVMLLIFILSAQDGAETTMLSEKVTRKIAGFVLYSFDNYSAEMQSMLVSELNHFIRKCAHLSLYCGMGFFIYICAFFFFKKRVFQFLPAFVIPVIFAVTDEMHQQFVDGRTPLASDVVIDTIGALIGIFAAFLIISAVQLLYNEHLNKRKG